MARLGDLSSVLAAMGVNSYADLAHPRIDPENPIKSALANERAIADRLRADHPDPEHDWGTWENVQKVRNGEPPVRPPKNRK